MNLTFFIVTAALLALAQILRMGLSRYRQDSRTGNLAFEIQPLDLEAFRNLADPVEEEYLRRRLLPGDYRKVRRARLRAMAAYVHIASHNAAILARIGQSAPALADPRGAEAARQLINDAFLLRRTASLALVRIYVAMVWPGPIANVVPLQAQYQYQRVGASAMLFGRLHDPTHASRFSVAVH